MDVPDVSVNEKTRIIDEDGNVVDNTLHDRLDISDKNIKDMYYNMKLSRIFDKKAVKYQRKGEIGTYPESSGQEGSFVSTAMCLNDDDWLIPSYREHIAMHMVGYNLKKVLLYWKGTFEGCKVPDDVQCLPPTVPIASQIPHAVGMAWAEKMKHKESNGVYMCHFGDGATSEGDFHEGLNFAGVFDTPNVFICNNNQWAISLPVDKQTGSETLAQKAEAYGIKGTRIDGMDPLAVYLVTNCAVKRARKEYKPILIESVVYRYGAHTTADDPSVYREKDAVDMWKDKDPIERLKKYMIDKDIIDGDEINNLDSKAQSKIEDIFEYVDNYTDPSKNQMYDYMYEKGLDEFSNKGDIYDR